MLKRAQKQHENNDVQDWSAVRHENDRHELFLFEDKESRDTVPDVADTKVSWGPVLPSVCSSEGADSFISELEQQQGRSST